MHISSLKGGYKACHKKVYEEIQGIYLPIFTYLRQNVYKDLNFNFNLNPNFKPWLVDVLLIRKKKRVFILRKWIKKQKFFTVREGKGENKLFCNTLWCLFNFRKAIVQYRMFRQVRADGGNVFYMSFFIEEEYQYLRDNASHIAPYGQTHSKQVSMYRYVYTDVDAYTVQYLM